MNDGVTYPCSFAKVRAEAAYMLFYCRTTTRTYTTRADQVRLPSPQRPPSPPSPPPPPFSLPYMARVCAPPRSRVAGPSRCACPYQVVSRFA